MIQPRRYTAFGLTVHGSIATLARRIKECTAGTTAAHRAMSRTGRKPMKRIGTTILLAGAMALPLGLVAVAQETGGSVGAGNAKAPAAPNVTQAMLNNAAKDS